VQQFSPAMFVDVIALQPLLPCMAAAWQRTTQVRGVEWIMWTTHVHVGGPPHLCGRGGRA